jgi:hypothetical protein
MEMVAHQATAQQPEGAAGAAQRLEEALEVGVVGEVVALVVAPVQRMIDHTYVDGAEESSHAWALTPMTRRKSRKKNRHQLFYRFPEAALTLARMPALIASGSSGQAARRCPQSGRRRVHEMASLRATH